MTQDRGTTKLSDRVLTRLLRVSVLTLVVGLVGFGVFYYMDQHVSGAPSFVDQQVASAEAAVRKAPGNLDARLQLAAVYQADKRNSDALAQYEEILKADSGNRLALIGRGYVYIQSGDLAKATADYKKITGAAIKGEFAGADPQLQEAHYYLGVIAVMQKKPKDALTELNSALKIESTDSDALYQVGLAQLQLGQPKLAVEAFRKGLDLRPDRLVRALHPDGRGLHHPREPRRGQVRDGHGHLLQEQAGRRQEGAPGPHRRLGRRRRHARPGPHRPDRGQQRRRDHLVQEGPHRGPHEHRRDVRPGRARRDPGDGEEHPECEEHYDARTQVR